MKYKLITILSLLYLGAGAQSNANPTKKNAIKANLLSPIFNTLNLSYQHLLTVDRSINVVFSYMDFNDFNNSFSSNQTKNNIQGTGVTLEYRVHFASEEGGLGGAYVAPFVRYLNYTRNSTETISNYIDNYPYGSSYQTDIITEKGTYQSVGIGLIFGYQFLIKNTIMIDFFGGPVYQKMIQKTQNRTNSLGSKLSPSDNLLSEQIPNVYLSGYSLRGGITVGMAF